MSLFSEIRLHIVDLYDHIPQQLLATITIFEFTLLYIITYHIWLVSLLSCKSKHWIL